MGGGGGVGVEGGGGVWGGGGGGGGGGTWSARCFEPLVVDLPVLTCEQPIRVKQVRGFAAVQVRVRVSINSLGSPPTPLTPTPLTHSDCSYKGQLVHVYINE